MSVVCITTFFSAISITYSLIIKLTCPHASVDFKLQESNHACSLVFNSVSSPVAIERLIFVKDAKLSGDNFVVIVDV